jgi:hypothetical protein
VADGDGEGFVIKAACRTPASKTVASDAMVNIFFAHGKSIHTPQTAVPALALAAFAGLLFA